MNFKALLFLSMTIEASAEILTLASEDRFAGKLLSISSEKGLLIESPRAPEPIAFQVNSFTQLDMESSAPDDPLQTERLTLSNGDILPGNLLSLDSEEIVYEGLVGGKLKLARKDVTTVRFGIKPQILLYEGPSPLDLSLIHI